MKINEHDFYSERANWSFEDIDYTSEVITNWIYEDEIKKRVKENTKKEQLSMGMITLYQIKNGLIMIMQ